MACSGRNILTFLRTSFCSRDFYYLILAQPGGSIFLQAKVSLLLGILTLQREERGREEGGREGGLVPSGLPFLSGRTSDLISFLDFFLFFWWDLAELLSVMAWRDLRKRNGRAGK